jgi:GTP-binding protein
MNNNIPKILIIGEMNSGKSTLFNRLAGEKKAVTTEIPGTTRDWLSKTVDFEDKTAELIDTAGFLETQDSHLETQIKQVWQEKLKEATIFLIVVDSKIGPTPRIKTIINQIRSFNKPIILVINKVDNSQLAQEKLSLFSELGIENSLWISALLGKNISELKNTLAQFLPRIESSKNAKLKIAIIGRPNVGKSTLLNALTGQERAIVNKESGTTRDELEAEFNSQINLVDTPGLKRPNKIKTIIDFFSSRRSIHMSQNADLIIFVLDASEGLVQQEYKIARLLAHYNKPIILVLNKIDLLEPEEIQKTEDYIKYKLKFLGEFPLINISANLKQNIEPLRALIQETSQKLH